MKKNIPTPQSIFSLNGYKSEIDITIDIIIKGLQKRQTSFNIHNLPYKDQIVIDEVISRFRKKGWKVEKHEHPYDWREDNNSNEYITITI